jgi:hypothetical protein
MKTTSACLFIALSAALLAPIPARGDDIPVVEDVDKDDDAGADAAQDEAAPPPRVEQPDVAPPPNVEQPAGDQ